MAAAGWKWPSAALAATVLLLAGCGRDYELKIRLPADSQVATRGDVFLDGVRVGTITKVERAGENIIASIVIEDRRLAEQKIKPGVLATARKDMGIDLDTSRIDVEAQPLPSGTTIEGQTKLEFLVKKYATWQTVVSTAVAVLAQVVMVWTLRSFFKLGFVVISLIISAFLASLVYPLAVPAVERVYAETDKAKETRTDEQGHTRIMPLSKPTSKRVVHGATRPGATGRARAGVAMQPGPSAQQVVEVVKHIPRPDPRVVAFLGSWLILFVVVQFIMGWALRGTATGK